MQKAPLQEYLQNHSQEQVAKKLGLSQGAISKMLISGRRIWITEYPCGCIEAIEEKLIGKQRPASAPSQGEESDLQSSGGHLSTCQFHNNHQPAA